MPSLVIRNLDESIINALKQRVVEHQRSTEAEHHAILADVLLKPARKSFAEALANIPNVGVDADFQRLNDDTHITATALTYDLTMVTRNVKDF